MFYCAFVWHIVHERGAYLAFTAQRHKLLSNCRDFKSLDDFNIKKARQLHWNEYGKWYG